MGGGVTFSASPATINAPTGNTDSYYVDGFRSMDIVFTPPPGVKVVLCEMNAEAQDDEFSCTLINSSNVIIWVYADGIVSADNSSYVAVTPNKTYKLALSFNNYSGSGSVVLYYSPEINNHSVDVKDY